MQSDTGISLTDARIELVRILELNSAVRVSVYSRGSFLDWGAPANEAGYFQSHPVSSGTFQNQPSLCQVRPQARTGCVSVVC